MACKKQNGLNILFFGKRLWCNAFRGARNQELMDDVEVRTVLRAAQLAQVI